MASLLGRPLNLIDAPDKSMLVIGADGVLGSKLVASLQERREIVWSSTKSMAKAGGKSLYLNLSDVRVVALPSGIATAVLCAGITSVERCRADPVGTRVINVGNTVALARQLVDAGIFTIFLSTNMVFDGSKPFSKLTDATCPTTEYGRQKVDAENALLELGDLISVVRFSKIAFPQMPLLKNWAIDLIGNRTIHPFYDAVMAPLSVSFALETIYNIAARKFAGITQASANQDISYEQAAMHLADKLHADPKLVEPMSYREVGIAHMPSHTTLNVDRLRYLGLQSPSPLEAVTADG